MAGALTKRELLPRRWFDFEPLSTLRHEMDDLFENFLVSPVLTRGVAEMAPRLDVAETPEAIEVTTDLPGIKPEEVDIEIRENMLTISGRHEEEKKEEGDGRKLLRVERRMGSFSRSVWLPCAVNEANVAAEMKDGVLNITLPKAEAAKAHKVSIKA